MLSSAARGAVVTPTPAVSGTSLYAEQKSAMNINRYWEFFRAGTPGAVSVSDFSTGLSAPVSAVAPTGSEAGVYVRVVSQPAGGAAVTANQGTPGPITAAWPIKITDGTNTAAVTAGSALKVDGSAVTQPVSGSVSATQGTSPWVSNVTQFGSNNVATGTGASGVGIPRVTVSNDSNVLATQSGTWNVGFSTGSNTIGAVTGTSADNSANSSLKLPILTSRANAANPTWTEGNQVPSSVDLSGNQRTLVNSWFGSSAPTVGQKTMANSLPVAVASDQTAITVAGNKTNNNAAPGATNVGALVALANATAPSFTEGNLTLASVDLSGNLRSNLVQFGNTNVVTGGVAGLVGVGGNVASGVADTGNPVKIGGIATTSSTQQTAVSTGQRVNKWNDLNGATMIRPGFRTTYTANYRLTTRPYSLSNAFGAAGIKQYATIYHAVSATKTVRVKYVCLYVKSSSAAATYMFEIRRLSATTAPATGNPAVTPILHNTVSGAAEATCLSLPTTAGSESGANQGWGNQELQIGITGASGSTTVPPPVQVPIVLYNDANVNNLDIEPLIMRAGVAEGFAVIVDASAAATFTCTIVITFTEE